MFLNACGGLTGGDVQDQSRARQDLAVPSRPDNQSTNGELRDAALASARAAAAAGELGLAVEHFEAALGSGDHDPDTMALAAAAAGAVGRVELAERWARAADRGFRDSGRVADAERLWADRALRYIRRPGASESGFVALAGRSEQAELAARAGDHERARQLADEVLAAAIGLEDSDAAARAALALYMAGEPTRALAILTDLRNAAFDAGDAKLEAWRSGDLAACAAGLGDIAGGIGYERSGLVALGGADDELLVPSLHVGLACLLGIAGELDQSEAVVASLTDHPSTFTELLALVPDMILAISRGDHGRALRNARQLAPLKDLAGPYLFGILLSVEAYAHYMSGERADAVRVLDELDEWIGARFHQSLPIRLELRMRIAADAGDVATLTELRDRSTDMAAVPVAGDGLKGNRHLAEGLLAKLAGGDPVPDLERAARHLMQAPRLLPAGLTWCDVAEAALAAGDHATADRCLDQAETLAEGAGITALRPRIAELRTRRERPVSLTPRETELMVLLARGLTNKDMASVLYLSPQTVRNQLHTLYTKLGVSRRAEVAALAVRLGIAEGSSPGH